MRKTEKEINLNGKEIKSSVWDVSLILLKDSLDGKGEHMHMELKERVGWSTETHI